MPPARVVAIIQARMGSSRLPGKVLLPLDGRPVLAHVVERVRASGIFDGVVVATTDSPPDDPVARLGGKLGADVFRGSESDVLGRYAGAAKASGADIVVRITADCPLIDPDVMAEMVVRFRRLRADAPPADVLTNSRVRSFPRGLDVEIFTREALGAADAEATASHQREHVTPFLYENPARFRIVDHLRKQDASSYRLTLDTTEDYELLKRIFSAGAGLDPSALRLDKVLDLLETNPAWASINAHIRQRPI
jgi:spore coat polysaccharide biosynthesis protein SpsF